MSAISDLIAEGLVEENVPLGPLTTYKSGGPSRFYARPSDEAALFRIARAIADEGDMPVLVLGRGSNLLVADTGFGGVTIHMAGGFDELSFDGLAVTAGSGVPLPLLARRSVDAGIAGLEFFVGVPGSVGGAVRQNAGCFGVETRDRMTMATILDMRTGAIFSTTPDELEMSYRHSNLRPDWVVTEARFEGTGSDTSQSRDELRRITRWRKENQPGGTLNAGSVFKNPTGVSAGALIEGAGLKGHSVGEVAVSEKHANFFVAGRNATSDQVRRLIDEVRKAVAERSGVVLEQEIQMVGFDDED